MIHKIILSAFIIVVLVGGQSDAALITDGFTFTDPATSAFTYGRYTAGLDPTSYSFFTQGGDLGAPRDPNYVASKYAGLEYKNDPGSIDPNVIYNSTSSVITTEQDYGDITFNPGELTFGPYLGPTVARFTATAAGTYDISALFTPVQVGNTTPNYYVFINGIVTSALTSSSYTGSASLGVGGTIDFVVFGGNVNNKTTQVGASVVSEPAAAASVVAVPEPATLVMCGTAGLIAWAVAARRGGGLPGGTSASRTSGPGSGGASLRSQAGRSRQTSDVPV
jgi:hypothetical protein